jgi:hypothetical protein
MRSDYDGAWKSLVHTRLREVLTLFFPDVAAEIDWKTRPKLLAQELQKLGIKEENLNGQRVDFLIEATTRSGQQQVIFLHLEIQSKKEPGFAQRIYRYNQLIASSTKLDVVTLVVLADLDPKWRPCRYEREVMGCRVVMEYPVCKLLDLVEQAEEKRGVAWLAVRAQLAALETRGNSGQRLNRRLELLREFLRMGWKKKEVSEALRLISWMMKLPQAESLQFRKTVSNWREMKLTLPLTDLEEIWLEEGMEKGMAKGRQEGMEKGIQQGRQEGIECGEWIGKVQLLESLMNKAGTPATTLKKESLKQLKSRFQRLEKEYHRKHRKT